MVQFAITDKYVEDSHLLHIKKVMKKISQISIFKNFYYILSHFLSQLILYL